MEKEKHISKRRKEQVKRKECKVFLDRNWIEIKRQPVEVWTRVMGYHRPVSQYNLGKKSEFHSRQYFDQEQSENSDFIRKFWEREDE